MIKGNVLVTGGCGFIGKEVTRQLLDKSYAVTIVDRHKHDESKKNIYCKHVRYINTDTRDVTKFKPALKKADYCIHLAGLIGGLDYIEKFPATILSENNQVNASVIESCADLNIKRLVFVSSGLVFEKSKVFPSKESNLIDTPMPVSTYGIAKLVGENYCKAYQREKGLNYSIARLFNIYGPGQNHTHLIPDLIRKIKSNEYPLELFGNGKQTRCMTYVSDAASGIIATMEKSTAINTDFNISANKEYQVIDIAKKIWKLLKRPEKFKIAKKPEFSIDVVKRIPCVEKATDVLNWSAKINLDEGLRKTIEVDTNK
jgi:nucleoside-diphosphate-sugar epimerase